jgi:hypothetical protein
MLGGIRELLPRRRIAILLAAPMLVGACGSVGTALALARGDAAAPERLVRPALTSPAGDDFSPQYLRTLRRGLIANLGGARFKQRPPLHLTAATLAASAIPGIAIDAYEHGAGILAQDDPGCHLGWYDLAAIGRVESDNGLTWGPLARVSPNGTLSPPILGPVLDGQGGTPAIPTPDRGVLEHGGKWERAVGPMQFLPSTWLEYGQDGNGDGVKNPQNYWDAALTTAVYLCANGGNLATKSGFDAGVLAYNHSPSYVALVGAWARFYRGAGTTKLTGDRSLLPIGYSRLPSHPSHHGAGGHRASPATVLAAAVRATDSSRTYRYLFQALSGGLSGRAVAYGDASVDVSTSDASMSLFIPGTGTLGLCVLARPSGRATYVQLPDSVDEQLGEPGGSWLAFDGRLAEQGTLPSGLRAWIELSSAYLRSSVDLLAGSSVADAQTGHATVDGAATTAFAGPANLATAAFRVPAERSDLRFLATQAGTDVIEMTAWIGHDSLVRQAAVTFPRCAGLSRGALTLEASYSGFGAAISTTLPRPLAGYPPTSSTTSSSSSSTTSTTTSTTTTTTTAPSGSTTSTTSGGTESSGSSGSSGADRQRKSG